MTEINDTLSLKENEQFKVLLTKEGRKNYFAKECLDEVTVLRRINEEPWKEIARDVRTPFLIRIKYPRQLWSINSFLKPKATTARLLKCIFLSGGS